MERENLKRGSEIEKRSFEKYDPRITFEKQVQEYITLFCRENDWNRDELTDESEVLLLYTDGQSTQKTAAALMRGQVDYQIISSDELLAQTPSCGVVVVPRCQSMSLVTRQRLDELSYEGVLVFFVGDEPETIIDGGDEVYFESMGGALFAELGDLAGFIRMFGKLKLSLSPKMPMIYSRGVSCKEKRAFILINRSKRKTAEFWCSAEGRMRGEYYDVSKKATLPAVLGKKGVRLGILPMSAVVIITDREV